MLIMRCLPATVSKSRIELALSRIAVAIEPSLRLEFLGLRIEFFVAIQSPSSYVRFTEVVDIHRYSPCIEEHDSAYASQRQLIGG